MLCWSGIDLHILVEFEALRDLREVHADLSQGILSVKEFMWQHSLCGVAVYVDKRLKQKEAALSRLLAC